MDLSRNVLKTNIDIFLHATGLLCNYLPMLDNLVENHLAEWFFWSNFQHPESHKDAC